MAIVVALAAATLPGEPSLLLSLGPSILCIFAVGFADDLRGLDPWTKLAGQGTAAVMTAFIGTGSGELPEWWTLLWTISWVVAVTTAMNLIDGADGLAAGLAAIAAAVLLAGGIHQGNRSLADAAAALMGAMLGFLRHNFHPAAIFLGDSGSMTAGLVLACLTIRWTRGGEAGWAPAVLVLAIPLTDLAVTIVRRLLARQRLFQGDCDHIHHRVLSLGFGVRRSVLLLHGLALAFGVVAFLLTVSNVVHSGAIFVIAICAAGVGARSLGYPGPSSRRATRLR